MKKIVVIVSILFAVLFSGCATSTGQFLKNNKVAIYKVVEKGIVTFMTKEQIEEKKLDKIADVVEYMYSVDTESGKLVE